MAWHYKSEIFDYRGNEKTRTNIITTKGSRERQNDNNNFLYNYRKKVHFKSIFEGGVVYYIDWFLCESCFKKQEVAQL